MLGDVGPSREACHILQIVGNQSGIVARGIVMSCLSLQQLVSPAPAPASDVTWHYGGQGTSWQQILFNGKRLTESSHFIITWNICTDLLKRSLNPSVLLITVHYSCEKGCNDCFKPHTQWTNKLVKHNLQCLNVKWENENLRILFFLKLIVFEPPSDPLEGLTLRGLDSEDLCLAAEWRECAEKWEKIRSKQHSSDSDQIVCANPNDWFPSISAVSTPQRSLKTKFIFLCIHVCSSFFSFSTPPSLLSLETWSQLRLTLMKTL